MDQLKKALPPRKLSKLHGSQDSMESTIGLNPWLRPWNGCLDATVGLSATSAGAFVRTKVKKYNIGVLHVPVYTRINCDDESHGSDQVQNTHLKRHYSLLWASSDENASCPAFQGK